MSSKSSSPKGKTSNASKSQKTTSQAVVKTKQVASAEKHLEILTEHFGYSPKIILERLGYISNEHLYRIIETFESFALQCLLDQNKQSLDSINSNNNNKSKKSSKGKNKKKNQEDSDKDEESKEREEKIEFEAESGVHSILTLFENALDHTIDTFEILLNKNVCGITKNQAENLVLNHHKGLDLRSKERREIEFRNWQRESKIGGGKNKKGSDGNNKEKELEDGSVEVGIKDKSELDLEVFSKDLEEKERVLRRKINAAKATRSSLKSALTLSEKRLSRMNQLHSNFSPLLGDSSASKETSTNQQQQATQDSNPIKTTTSSLEPIEKTIPVFARQLRADSITLLKSLKELKELNPLGESLDLRDQDGKNKNQIQQQENPGPWNDREDYIKLKSNRATSNVIAERKEERKDLISSDDLPTSSGGVRRKNSSIGIKRGRQEDEEEHDSKRTHVGKLQDVESISAKLSEQS